MKKVVLAIVALFVCAAASLLGLVILISSVGGTAQAVSCAISRIQSPPKPGSVTTTTAPASNPDCGAAAVATLPSSPVLNNGLPANYVPPSSVTTAETVAVAFALAQLGKPYLWGGSGPAAFDCSGLTMVAWRQAGVTLLHYTGDQINEGSAVGSYANISPGDLVLVPGSDGTVSNPGHVGLYIGEGLVESAVDVQYGIIVQPYAQFVSGGLSGIRHVG
ncbi:MAG: C40 family peptidase [Acidimicrobiales bacterium]